MAVAPGARTLGSWADSRALHGRLHAGHHLTSSDPDTARPSSNRRTGDVLRRGLVVNPTHSLAFRLGSRLRDLAPTSGGKHGGILAPQPANVPRRGIIVDPPTRST